MAMNRSLGEGKVVKLVKKYAFILDDRLGKVYFPLAAACVHSDCADLREKYNEGDLVIFTAQKQQSPINDCAYMASSVIKKKELISCMGKICETNDKFCYVEVKKYGKVFVPYSARSDSGKPWLGRGAEKNKNCELRIFRQPDINTCKYVAFGCDMILDDSLLDDSNRSTNMSKSTDSRTQIGCLVRYSETSDCHVYSAQTGLSRLPHSLMKEWMCLGCWMRYDVTRDSSSVPNGSDNGGRCTWIVKDPLDMGMLYEVEEDQMDNSRLQLNVICVVNRVSLSSRHAWLWNDFIGRVYVPPASFRHGLRAMESVSVRALYTGAFEDVPWSALQLEVIGADDDLRLSNAQLLLTDDNWKITHVQQQTGTFYGFMENIKFGSAFIAWTDMGADGDVTPVKDQRCRATVFKQHRDKKHQWRAVMVAPLDKDEQPSFHYPLYSHSGIATLPSNPYRLPCSVPSPPLTAPSTPPIMMTTVQKPIGTRSDKTMASVVSAMESVVLSSGGPPGAPIPPQLVQRRVLQPIGTPNNHMSVDCTLSTVPSPLGPLVFPQRGSSPSPDFSPSALSPGRLLSSDSSDSYSDNLNHEFEMGLPMGNFAPGYLKNEFSHWLPPSSNSLVSFPLTPSNTLSIDTNESDVNKADVSTQTEMISEQRVLRDIVQNRELLMKVFEACPSHIEAIMNMKWQTTVG